MVVVRPIVVGGVPVVEASMSALRVVGRASGLGLYNITVGRPVQLTVEPAGE